MEPNAENSCRRDAIKEKLRQNFDGKIVRKDLTKRSRKVRMSRFMCWSFYWASTVVQMTKLLLKKACRM